MHIWIINMFKPWVFSFSFHLIKELGNISLSVHEELPYSPTLKREKDSRV